MPLLSPHLAFTQGSNTTLDTSDPASALPPPGTHLLVTDTLTAPAQFAILHLVLAAVACGVPVVWVDFALTGRASWDSIAKRLGTRLPNNETSFIHVQPTPLPAALSPTPSTTPLPLSPPLFDAAGNPTLRATFDATTAALPPTPTSSVDTTPAALLVLDGLSELAYAGIPPVEVARFVRAVQARYPLGTVVSAMHADDLQDDVSADDDPADELLSRLLRSAHVWWRVEGLASGRSGDVSGEISVCALGGGRGKVGTAAVPRASPLQYRLEAAGVKMFAKGTGRGFL